MADIRWQSYLERFGFALFGLAYALYSSLPILHPDAAIWNNDEGSYLKNGLNGVISFDIRYGLFSTLVRAYFLFTESPFLVVIIHKMLVLAAFLILFQKRIIASHGLRFFVLLFSAFIFLNSYFLRDSLIFLFVLLAVEYNASDKSIHSAFALVPLTLIRPQTLFLFIRPWVTILSVLGFLLFLRHLFTVTQLSDNGIKTIIHYPFWQNIASYSLTTLSNLNPLASASFFAHQKAYLHLVLIIAATVAMFAVFAQMVLAIFFKEYRNEYTPRLWCGMISLLILYGSIGIPVDKRVYLTIFSPFLLHVKPNLLRLRNAIWLAMLWVTMLGVRALWF